MFMIVGTKIYLSHEFVTFGIFLISQSYIRENNTGNVIEKKIFLSYISNMLL